MTWGILAYLATTPRARRYLSAVSAFVSLGVGLTTVYIGTHWLSDVLLGWAAGLLILLALPWFEPLITRTEVWILSVREQWRNRRGLREPVPPAPVTTPEPVLLPQALGGGAAAEGVQEAASTGQAPGATGHPGAATRARAHPAHPVRPERTPPAPAGSRRPPHADRSPRNSSAGGPSRPVAGGPVAP